MSRLRVAAFLSGGPIALGALDALAATHQVSVVVRPRSARPLRSAWRGAALRVARAVGVLPADQVDAWAGAAGVPIVASAEGDEPRTAERIRSFTPDFGCIATYPRRIPDVLLAASGHACVNLHSSLLPRHRGASPLFWTYHAGDPDGGVTIHLATSRLDGGAILLQERFPIGRGEPVVDVHARSAASGGALLARAVTLLAEGTAVPQDQDESCATAAPSPAPGRRYAELTRWSCAQAWHFLAGLLARYREPFVDTAGQQVRYSRVHGYEEREPRFAPGSVVREGAGWTAWTPDGVVRIS
jgi:methionyl-tRNA formyltransferase